MPRADPLLHAEVWARAQGSTGVGHPGRPPARANTPGRDRRCCSRRRRPEERTFSCPTSRGPGNVARPCASLHVPLASSKPRLRTSMPPSSRAVYVAVTCESPRSKRWSSRATSYRVPRYRVHRSPGSARRRRGCHTRRALRRQSGSRPRPRSGVPYDAASVILVPHVFTSAGRPHPECAECSSGLQLT